MRFQPFWFDSAIRAESLNCTLQSLPNSTDVVIIGGGFTGLWTAIMTKLQSPETDLVVIEKGLCGQGASGRNGGAMLTWSTKFMSLMTLFGLEQAKFLAVASEQAVHEIKAFTEKHQIACDCRVDGTYYTYSNRAQHGALEPVIKALSSNAINHWRKMTAHDVTLTGSTTNSAGWYSPHAGSVQPALLVRGLRRVAISLGIKVVEHTEYHQHSETNSLSIETSKGTINARKLVFAVNAWLPSLVPSFARKVVLVSSDMVITKPIPDTLRELNLTHGAPIIDSRIFVNYYRTTSCGRLMLGKGGNYFSVNNRVSGTFDAPSRYQTILNHSLKRFFPNHDFAIERSWTGPSDRSVTGMPFFGHLNGSSNILFGSGYSGNGVVQSFLGGKILSSLVLELNNEWTDCALVDQTLPNFPPDPIRTIGAYVVRDAIRRKEHAEDENKVPWQLDTWLSRLSGSAAKVDMSAKEAT
ncbi:FAD-dependent oxidoreductase [Pseudoalteromonas xiamenensis]|uniref:FAD-dependent oxidoreductase n=1 Tax=Pseudoalteromonas xiamenensis TaxID=882626 RepID=UPI0027E44A26|nr:FAD-dependent oxidoreductase [Pseudoalteromonas xiamenensis]WMN59651.1 FAD-dependent oxidoreductase [Pseudoalteromonas xiamenensis]